MVGDTSISQFQSCFEPICLRRVKEPKWLQIQNEINQQCSLFGRFTVEPQRVYLCGYV